MDECGGHGQGHEEGESVACRLVHASSVRIIRLRTRFFRFLSQWLRVSDRKLHATAPHLARCRFAYFQHFPARL